MSAWLGDLLDELELFVRRFAVVDEPQATAAVLWVAHTWTVDAARATPYLHIYSAEAESGKTRLMEVLRELVRAPLMTMNISDAALFRAIDAKQPTLFFDEVDAIFNPKARERGVREDLRALLNAGYRRGESVYRMGGGNRTTLEEFAVFCPKALAGLGTLPPTLASRCIPIGMKRRRLNEPVEDFFPEDLVDETERLRIDLESWATTATDGLRVTRPIRVEGVRDRTNEVWRPLLAIAELAGEPWAARARRAAVALTSGNEDEPSLGLLLLDDIREILFERDTAAISTADLIFLLSRRDESPWGEWWVDPKTDDVKRGASRRLAQLLKPYRIKPLVVRIGTETPRGYRRDDFVDAWERFLPPRVSATSATCATSEAQSQANVADVADVAHTRDGNGAVEWLARDGVWRPFDTDPPAFAGEIIRERIAAP